MASSLENNMEIEDCELWTYFNRISEMFARCKICGRILVFHDQLVLLGKHLVGMHHMKVNTSEGQITASDQDAPGVEIKDMLSIFTAKGRDTMMAILEQLDGEDKSNETNNPTNAENKEEDEDKQTIHLDDITDEFEKKILNDQQNRKVEDGKITFHEPAHPINLNLDRLLSMMVFQDDIDINRLSEPIIQDFLRVHGHYIPAKIEALDLLMGFYHDARNALLLKLLAYQRSNHKFSLCLSEEWFFNRNTHATCFELTIHLGEFWHSLGVVPFCKLDPSDKRTGSERRKLYLDTLVGERLADFGLSWRDITSITHDSPFFDRLGIKFPVYQQKCYNAALQRIISDNLYVDQTKDDDAEEEDVTDENMPRNATRSCGEAKIINSHSDDFYNSIDEKINFSERFSEELENEEEGAFASFKDLTDSDKERMLMDDNYKYNSQDAVIIELGNPLHKRVKMLPQFETNLVLVRKILANFLASDSRREYIEGLLSNLQIPVKLIIDRPGRWNTTLAMVERFIEAKDVFAAALPALNQTQEESLLPEFCKIEFNQLEKLFKILRPLEVAVKHLALPDTTLLSAEIILNSLIQFYLLEDDPLNRMLIEKIKTEMLQVRSEEVVGLMKSLQCGLVEPSPFEYLTTCSYARMINMGAVMTRNFLNHPSDLEPITLDQYYRFRLTEDGYGDPSQPPTEKMVSFEYDDALERMAAFSKNFENLFKNFETSGRRSLLLDRLLEITNNVKPTSTRNPWRTFNACKQIKLKMKLPMSFELFNAYIFMKHFFVHRTSRREPDDENGDDEALDIFMNFNFENDANLSYEESMVVQPDSV